MSQRVHICKHAHIEAKYVLLCQQFRRRSRRRPQPSHIAATLDAILAHRLYHVYNDGDDTLHPGMSSLQSGLRSVKRDWSDNDSQPRPGSQSSIVSTRPSSQVYIKPQVPKPSSSSLSEESRAKRLRAIQAALDNDGVVLVDSRAANADNESASAHKSSVMKRPSLDNAESAVIKKRRQLPDSFQNVALEPVSLMSKAMPSSSRSSSSVRSPAPVIMEVRKDASLRAAAKPAKVFLSKEQLHILKLVEDGHSIFYTGSAGQCAASRTCTNEIDGTVQERVNLFFCVRSSRL